ncbi:MerR family regulatory protein [Rhodobacteraceae bacterium THAF1]|uniref:MerR family transcriptional regulator n=1 Tax=Palleronia sp. THAF1 TaxID=2587842 RepID=UPI000F3B1C1A|nr:MerR family transcriptional regulator [Palleronia sp. THAF1]QFU08198.1 MerR family regulatory protein [Palleronia sp. THAF1]VDC28752.1 MerR family regulatory protein [Rhodobacteraceae bacterium THAF1]
MPKSPDAFRTISEVAEWLDVPTHVLRFWESRFTQVKPVKRAGGRRYYRPADMELLGGIKRLLHDEGLTIRGVQKLLREEGVRHVSALSPALDSDLAEVSGKVITLVPNTGNGGQVHEWKPDDAAAEAVQTLTGQIEGETSEREAAESVIDGPPASAVADNADDAEPAVQKQEESPVSPSEGADVTGDGSLPEIVDTEAPLDPASEAPAPVETNPPPGETSVDVPIPVVAEGDDVAGSKLADIPMPDLDALPNQPLCIAPLIAKGRVARQREAETFAPIAARAKALLRDLNVRM